jgi:hypothetical protein
MTHDIQISTNQKFTFPAICVVCEKPNPERHAELTFFEHKFSAFEAASTIATQTTYHVEQPSHNVRGVPVCSECAQKLKSHHTWLKIISYASWITGTALAIFLPIEIWWKAAVLIAFLFLPGIISVIFPPAFNLTISKGTMTFEFTSETFANEFKKLNQKT